MYSIDVPNSNELDTVVTLIAPALVDTNKPDEGQARDRRRLVNNVELADEEGMIVVLRYDGEIVGAMVLQDRKGMCIIIHSNILEEHKRSLGSMLLLDYTLNTVFKSRDVYILACTKEFESKVKKVRDKVYKLKSDVSSRVSKIVTSWK